MITVYVESVGVVAPGLIGWPAARLILDGTQPHVSNEIPPLAPAVLPPTERRRCIGSAKLALTAAHEAFEAAKSDTPRALVCVFASSDGDGQVIRQITDNLADDVPTVSPTRFSNSVHNAAAGYWSIATGLQQASTCISAFDDTFAAGLLEAAAQVADESVDVLLTAFDMRFPEPFCELRPTAIDCAIALMLAPLQTDRCIARLQISMVDHQDASAMPAAMPQEFLRNPAARGLPLLAALSAPAGQTIHLDYLEQSLAVTVLP